MVFLLSLLLQTTILPFLKIGGVMPDLLLIFLIFLALFRGSSKGGIAGFFVGLLEDLLVGRCLGSRALSGFLTCYVAGVFEGKVYKENPLVPFSFAFLGSVFYQLVFFVVQGFAGVSFFSFWPFVRYAVLQGLLNGVIGVLLFYPFSNLIQKERRSSQFFRLYAEVFRR
ncbi:MAG: Rod shape-determining protein [Thermoanaerobacterales bacterium 50_218]|nr:MAG: Rod shape-determining protein [Thermoanaerobacterales bacterium 50_218]